MTAQKFPTYYLCCRKNKKAFFKQRVKAYYRHFFFFTDDLCCCDKVLVVGEEDQTMKEEISLAKDLGIGIETLNVRSLTHAQKVELVENRPVKEPAFSARNRSKEYDL